MSVPPVFGMLRFAQRRSQQVTIGFISLKFKPSFDIIIHPFAALASARLGLMNVTSTRTSLLL